MRQVEPGWSSTMCVPAGGLKLTVPNASPNGVTVNVTPAHSVPRAPAAVALISKTPGFGGGTHPRDTAS
jgi:hypothetical protein